MSDWPIGISTGCFYRHRIFDVLEILLRNGFLMIEICSSPPHLDYHDTESIRKAARLIGQLGMEAYSFHAPFDVAIDITSNDPNARRYALDEILKAAEAAALLQVRYFVTHPGPEKTPESHNLSERMERMKHAADGLNRVSQRCHELGVGFILENMLPHLFFGNVRDMLWIMGAIESINVGTCLDVGHAHLSGDVYRVMYKLSGHLKLIHANDNLGKADDHLPPGKGAVDWKKLVSELRETGFRGGLILELAGGTDRDPATVLAEARAARTYLRHLSRRQDLSFPPTASGYCT